MPHVLICGAAGYGNLGDDAIVEGMLAQLRGAVEAELTVVGGEGLVGAAARLGFTPLRHEDAPAWLAAVERTDLVLIGGGGLLYDSTYLPRLAELLPPRSNWLYQSAKIAAAARTAAKPMALFGIGVGPLLTDAGRRAARFVADSAQWITTRDDHSTDLLIEIGAPPSKLHTAADPAVFMPSAAPGTGPRWESLTALARLPRPWVGLNARPWYVFPDSTDARERRRRLNDALAEIGDSIIARTGGSVVLLPLQTTGDDDVAVLGQVSQAMARPAKLVDPPGEPAALQAFIGELDLVVGMRLHSLILAANAGTPFVALSYDPKIDAFAHAMRAGEHCFAIEGLSSDQIVAAAEGALADRAALRVKLAEAMRRMRERGAVSAELVAATLQGMRDRQVRPARLPQRTAEPGGIGSAVLPRVLMQIRPDWESNPGGDVVQLRGTRDALQALGVAVSVSAELHPDLTDFDIVHTFNATRPQEPMEHCANARRQGKPVVLSTVYWDRREFITRAHTTIDPDFEPPASQLADLASREAQAAVVMEMADLLLPNSEAERDLLGRNFGAPSEKCLVVPNAVDERFFQAAPDEFSREYGIRDFVLCVGRIELRKNQHMLLAALNDLDVPVVLIGGVADERYLEQCRARAGQRVTFIPELPHERLPSAYAAARVHALASWYDTPGLVSLEAAAAGCNIVSTDRGSAREYFGDLAWYCSPDDLDSIRQAALAAWEAPRTGRLREHVRANFTWAIAAERTLTAYRWISSPGPPRRWQRALAAPTQERADDEIARQAAQIQAYLHYVRALDETVAVQRRELQQRIAELEQYARSLEEAGREFERRLQAANREIEAITSRRLYRWSEWLALRLGWLRRRA